ncbi:mechanosensitive ion channel family protein [Ramlibacter sp.]|uniref:mechanosensitive ion channel family protein n=1 Tax=Ramlibacter sp. TaxID=1917967 RepID=UPI002BBA70FE|nr:mechanosensitive ion channel family protein [Ramlibacter sp.]HWI84436.1 mechanosensitive ion channel family protein [Ramlibacter sp.]
MQAQFLSSLFQENAWLATVVAALLAVVAALVVRRVGRALLLRATSRAPLLRAIVECSENPAGAVLPLAALQVVWTAAPDTLRWIGNVRHVNGLLLIAALTWLAMGVIGGLARGVIARNPVAAEDNLQARRIQTQATVLARTAMVLVLLAGMSMALMTFPGARQLGASLLASAGVIGIVGGIAARPVFSNLIAGLQLALAQPIRMDDVLIVKGEWGRVEEITGTYVVLNIWDERRMIIPLQWFIENPFENWTRTSSQILGTVFLYLDFATPVEPLRAELDRIVKPAAEWDGRVCVLQVTDATERAMQVRILVSAANSGKAFDLRCKVREQMLAFIAREYPQCLPQVRSTRAGIDASAGPAGAIADAGSGPA